MIQRKLITSLTDRIKYIAWKLPGNFARAFTSMKRCMLSGAPETGKARSSVYDARKLFNSLPRKTKLFNLTFFPIICKQISVIYKAL